MIPTASSSPHAFVLPGNRTGVLLIHGLTGTPNEMRVVARGLNRAGYTVYAMQLAGHCGTMDDLLKTRWQDWSDSVERAADHLRTLTDQFFVGGLSMGAILALEYAARYPERVRGVLAYAPVFDHDGWAMPWHARLGAWLLPTFKQLGLGRRRVALETEPYGIKDVAIRRHVVHAMHAGDSAQAGLPGTPWFAAAEMYGLVREVKASLHKIKCPCLVVHPEEDDIASARNALRIWRDARAAPVRLVWLSDSYHMVTVDRERRRVIEQSQVFIEDACADPAANRFGAADSPDEHRVAPV